MACTGVRRATRLLRRSRAWICNVRVKRTRLNTSTGLVEQRSGYSLGWLINPHIQLHFHLWLRWSWRYKSKTKFSRMKTVRIERGCRANSRIKVFTYGGLRVEHWAAGDHGLSHYSQGFTEKFCQGVPFRRPKITIVFHRKWVLWWMITL